MKKQQGFSAVEIAVAIAVVILLIAGGLLVWNARRTGSQQKQTTDTGNTTPQTTLKEYVNAEYGFRFTYPDTWTLKTDLKELGRGGNEGEVSVTAPSGTKVYFSPHKEGKGGGCVQDKADRPDHTKNCATLRILSAEKTSGSSDEKPVYLTHRQITEPVERGGNTLYFIALTTTDESLKVGTAFTDAPGVVYQDIPIEGKGYVTAYITDAGDTSGFSYGTDKNYFDTKRVKEGLPVLASFRLL